MRPVHRSVAKSPAEFWEASWAVEAEDVSRKRYGTLAKMGRSASVSQEAARTAKLLGLGAWNGLSAEGQHGNVHLAHPTPEALLLVVRERGMPLGRLAILAHRATIMAQRWLERQ